MLSCSLLQKCAVLRLDFRVLGDDDGGGYLVGVVEVEEFDGGGGGPGGADGLGVDADEFIEL